MKNKGGRPSKLNDDVKKTLMDSLGNGMTLKAACKCANISYSTLACWVRKSRQSNQESIHTRITECIELAISKASLKNKIERLTNHYPQDWRYGRKRPNYTLIDMKNRVNSLLQLVGRDDDEV